MSHICQNKLITVWLTFMLIQTHAVAMGSDGAVHDLNGFATTGQSSQGGPGTDVEAPPIKNDVNQEHARPSVELQSLIEQKIIDLNVCKKSNEHVLSELSMFIDHIYSLNHLNKSSNFDQPYLDRFFQSYRSQGGQQARAEDVPLLPDPCEPILAELKANVLQQLASQKAEKPKFKTATIDFKTCEKPDYPRISLRNEQQGNVRSAYFVEEDGSMTSSFLMSSSGSPILDAVALDALSKCKFKAAVYDGNSIRSWAIVEYVWRLPR
jgi:TonB family protein